MNTKREIIINKINDFINKNTDEDTERLLRKIIAIVKEVKEEKNIYLFIDLINSNDELKSRLEEFVNTNMDDIRNGYYSGNKIMIFIKAYASINNIEIIDYDEGYDNGIIDDNIYYMYVREMRKIPLLTADEEKELARRVKQGDQEAKKKFIEANLRLVVSIAKSYFVPGVSFLDLIQDGNIGLMKALDNFNPELGYRFSTYAHDAINQSIIKGMCDGGARNIRIPNDIYYALKKFKKVYRELEQKGNVDLYEIAKVMEIPYEKVEILNTINDDTLSIVPNQCDEKGVGIIDYMRANNDTFEEVVHRILPEEIRQLFIDCKLTKLETTVMVMRFGLNGNIPMTNAEVSQALNKKKQRIQQIEADALEKIRKRGILKPFVEYLDNPNEKEYFLDDGSFDMDAYNHRVKGEPLPWDYRGRGFRPKSS